MTLELLEGGCFCKSVRYRLTSAPMFVHCCHCLNCQSQTGSAFVINAFIETDRIELVRGVPLVTTLQSGDGPHDDPTALSLDVVRRADSAAGRPARHSSGALIRS